MLSRRAFVAFGAAIGFVSSARADLYDDYINSRSKRPFASFLARASDGSLGKPGHSYVAIGVELDNAFRVYERILGYYPKNSDTFELLKAAFSRVTGDIRMELADVAWQVEYRVPLNEEKHKAALRVADTWMKNDPKYNLFANGGKNCSAFAAEVAQSIGLKVPSGAGSKFPMAFMTELRDLNK